MKTNLWWKWLLIAVLVLASIVFTYPASDWVDEEGKTHLGKIRLGLDLKGGYSFTVSLDEEDLRQKILEDHPDFSEDQVTAEVAAYRAVANENAVETIRNRVDSLGTAEPVITMDKGSGRIYVQIPGATEEQRALAERNIRAAALMQFFLVSKDSAEKAHRIFDKGLVPPGFRVATFKDKHGDSCFVRDKEAGDVDYRRLRAFGQDEGITGYKEFFMLEKDKAPNSDTEIYRPIFVRNRAEMTARNLSASVENDYFNLPVISLRFDAKDAEEFARITRQHNALDHPPGRQLAIVLDDLVYSAPVLREAITGGAAQISGSFTFDEANFLKNILNAGSMPARLKFEGQNFVHPTLGQDSIASAKTAIWVGVVAVLLFMAFYYRAMGLVADLALVLNFVLLPLCAIFASNLLSQFASDATVSGGHVLDLPVLTLPGIAGLLLSVGMAVDANVLIFERTREELDAKRPTYASVMAGYDRAFSAIFDGNLTTVITGVILFVVGSGLIRGFAVTLVAGILASMFTALVVTKCVFQSAVKNPTSWKPRMMQAVSPALNVPFIAKSRKFTLGAVALIVVTLAVTIVRGVSDPKSVFGIDFTGGTRIDFELVAAEAPADTVAEAAPAEAAAEAAPAEAVAETATNDVPAEAVAEAATNAVPAEAVAQADSVPEVPASGPAPDFAALADNPAFSAAIRKAAQTSAGIDDASLQFQQDSSGNWFLNVKTVKISNTLTTDLNEALNAATESGLDQVRFRLIGSEEIGSQIGEGLKRSAFWAIALATLAMLLYVGFRFELGFGLGAIVALVHDVLLTIGVFSCLGFQINLTIVAALLTIVGYGVNDTIVLFDRVREELRRDQKSSFPDLVNRCINRTLSRTVLTSLTTILPVAALLIFCSGDIRGFAACMLIGLIVSTFSSIFIASPVTLAFYRQKRPDFRKES